MRTTEAELQTGNFADDLTKIVRTVRHGVSAGGGMYATFELGKAASDALANNQIRDNLAEAGEISVRTLALFASLRLVEKVMSNASSRSTDARQQS